MVEIKAGDHVVYAYMGYMCEAVIAKIEGPRLWMKRARCLTGPHVRGWTEYNPDAPSGIQLDEVLPLAEKDILWARIVAAKLTGEDDSL